jgi:hypothetical protein
MPFAELYRSLFPSISESVFKELGRYLTENPHLEKWLYAPTTFNHLAQGDIVHALPACFINASGEIKKSKTPLPAILLSNTCDMSIDANQPRKQQYTIVPLLPFNKTRYNPEKIQSIKNNTITDMIYLPNIPFLKGDYIAQLDMACSISSEYVHKVQSTRERSSLSQKGYYYFMAKLSLHLTRPENDVNRV